MPIYLTLIPRSQEKRAEGVLSLNGAVFNAIKSKRRLSMVLKNGRSLVFKPALVAELPQWQQAFQVAGVAPAAVSAKPRGSSSSSQSRTSVSVCPCVCVCVCFSVCFDTRPRQSSPGIPPYTCAMHRSIVRAFIRANGSHDATCAGLVSPTSHEADEESPPPTSGSLDSMLDYLVATKLSFEICTPRSLITAVSSRLSD